MADYTGKNIFEKIGAFIPGYKGYSEKEGRRDTDKLLRMGIAKFLDSRKTDIDDVILQQTNEKKIEHIKELDNIKRKIDLIANQIRYASCGESGFFDVVQVDIHNLDRLYQFDIEIKEDVERLSNMIKTLRTSENFKKDCLTIMNILSELSEKISDRDKVLTEVK